MEGLYLQILIGTTLAIAIVYGFTDIYLLKWRNWNELGTHVVFTLNRNLAVLASIVLGQPINGIDLTGLNINSGSCSLIRYYTNSLTYNYPVLHGRRKQNNKWFKLTSSIKRFHNIGIHYLTIRGLTLRIFYPFTLRDLRSIVLFTSGHQVVMVVAHPYVSFLLPYPSSIRWVAARSPLGFVLQYGPTHFLASLVALDSEPRRPLKTII